jgi:hypothetical protein
MRIIGVGIIYRKKVYSLWERPSASIIAAGKPLPPKISLLGNKVAQRSAITHLGGLK